MNTTTLFCNVERTDFFHYNHITGQLTILVDDGSRKGMLVRSDSDAANLARQFHNEERHGVPMQYRAYLPLKTGEFADVWMKVIDYVNNQFTQALSTVTF